MRTIAHLFFPVIATSLLSSVLISCSDSNNSSTGGNSSQLVGFNGNVRSVVPVRDGSRDVYVAGDFTNYNGTPANRLIRLRADGSVAMNFTDGFDNTVEALALANDGSGDLYAVGEFTQYNHQPAPHIVRLNHDGSFDAGFQTNNVGFDDTPLRIFLAEDRSGDVYLGGKFTSYNNIPVSHLARVKANGSLDLAFDVQIGFAGNLPIEVRTLAPAPDGKLYAGGSFVSYKGTPSNGLIRINPDGSPDLTFVVGTGFAAAAPAGVQVIAPAKDGTRDIYVGGQFDSYNGQSVMSGLIRILETGILDTTFTPTSSILTSAIAPIIDGDGDIYVGGTGATQTGPTDRFVRLHRDGTLAASFREPRLLNEGILTIALAEDGTGDVYLGGATTVYNGILINHLARVHNDGSLAQ